MRLSLLVAHAEVNAADYFQLIHAEHRFDVQTAISGVECLNILRQQRPDVLVLDHNLLWGGGDGVLAHMREERHWAQVPVVFIHDGPANEISPLLETPVVCCLRRPYQFSELVRCIDYAARMNTRLPESRNLRHPRSPELYPLGGTPPRC
jgi:DNA-binding response OmpR family regulator